MCSREVLKDDGGYSTASADSRDGHRFRRDRSEYTEARSSMVGSFLVFAYLSFRV